MDRQTEKNKVASNNLHEKETSTELLVHVSSSSSHAADTRFRAMAAAYKSFEVENLISITRETSKYDVGSGGFHDDENSIIVIDDEPDIARTEATFSRPSKIMSTLAPLEYIEETPLAIAALETQLLTSSLRQQAAHEGDIGLWVQKSHAIDNPVRPKNSGEAIDKSKSDEISSVAPRRPSLGVRQDIVKRKLFDGRSGFVADESYISPLAYKTTRLSGRDYSFNMSSSKLKEHYSKDTTELKIAPSPSDAGPVRTSGSKNNNNNKPLQHGLDELDKPQSIDPQDLDIQGDPHQTADLSPIEASSQALKMPEMYISLGLAPVRIRNIQHLFPSFVSAASDFSPEKQSPWVTHKLQRYWDANGSAVRSHYKPKSISERGHHLDPQEFGMWIIESHMLDESTAKAIWKGLEREIGSGDCGYHIYASSDSGHWDSPGKDAKKVPEGRIKVWCCAETIRHVWAMLFTVSLGKIIGIGAEWISGSDSEKVVVMW